MGQLDGKTALVTGGTTGIGLAAARRFAAEGAYVFVTGRRKGPLDEAVASIGTNATGIASDVGNLDDLDRVMRAIEDRGAGLDVVFANMRRRRVPPARLDHGRTHRQHLRHQHLRHRLHRAEGPAPAQ